MRLIFFITLLYCFKSFSQLSYGDGSENCTWSSNIDLTQSSFNCDSIEIGSGATVTFSNLNEAIILRSQGDVLIEGTLNVSANGVSAGPGGTEDGDASLGGVGGDGGTPGGDVSGGGGAGGRYGDQSLPSNGISGTGGGTSGGVIASSGYGPESDFETQIFGGSHGGSGADSRSSGALDQSGGLPGAGGGVVVIITKGLVTVNGQILARGGQGGNPTSVSGFDQNGAGGGGGGSGGSIYIIGNSVINNGLIDATGGNPGVGGSGLFNNGGAGGQGGSGRIRIDTNAGTFSGNASTPTASVNTLPVIEDPLAGTPDPQSPLPNQQSEFNSDIEYGCSYKESNKNPFSIIFVFALGALVALGFLKTPKAFHHRL